MCFWVSMYKCTLNLGVVNRLFSVANGPCRISDPGALACGRSKRQLRRSTDPALLIRASRAGAAVPGHARGVGLLRTRSLRAFDDKATDPAGQPGGREVSLPG